MRDRRLSHPEKRHDDRRESTLAMCEGKNALTYEQARAILRRPGSKDKSRIAYHCPKCRHWHVGSPMVPSVKGKKRDV